jgi:hypothetical protein
MIITTLPVTLISAIGGELGMNIADNPGCTRGFIIYHEGQEPGDAVSANIYGRYNERDGDYFYNYTTGAQNTKYYVKAYADIIGSRVYASNWESFTTGITIPTLVTKSAGDVTYYSAQLAASLETRTWGTHPDITSEVKASRRGFCWAYEGYPDIDDNVIEESGEFSYGGYQMALEGLESGQIHVVRAFAENPQGIGYGDRIQFTTGIPEIEIENVRAERNRAFMSIRLYGEITEV